MSKHTLLLAKVIDDLKAVYGQYYPSKSEDKSYCSLRAVLEVRELHPSIPMREYCQAASLYMDAIYEGWL